MDVEFEDVTFKARANFWNRSESKCILKSVSGKFEAGHMSAIMGPSGAGKSSLLNAISGFRSTGVTAKSLKVNGQVRDEKLFRKLSCYITQEEVLQPMLSLQEVMMFAADLKLPSGTSLKHKTQLVNEIQDLLGLKVCCLTRTEMLSGGQKKRLSIALELINNPPVIFLDEPTSGLDNVSTTYTLKLLRRLAHQGRTIVCTIHQPSASLFQLFDQVYVLSRGRCVYQGATDQLVSFLSSVGFHCPTHYNPADYVIELTDGDHEENIDILAAATHNGKLSLYKSDPLKVPFIHHHNNNNNNNNNNNSIPPLNNNTEFGDNFYSELDSLAYENNNNNNNNNYSYTKVEDEDRISNSLFEDRLQSEKGSGTNLCVDFPTSGFSQFCTLYRRMTLQMYRNKIALNIQFYHHLLCAIAVGVVYFDKAKDGEEFFNHLKFCLGVVLFHTFTYCMIPVITFPFEIKLLKREYFNRWYSLRPYYIAMQLARLPTMIFFSMIFLTVAYFMTGLPIETYRFFVFCVIGVIVSLTAEGMGMFIGSIFSVTNGSAVAPLTLAPFLGLATYGFDFAKEIPWYISILMKMSFLRSGTVGIVITVFGMGRKKLDCYQLYCHFADPKVLLQYLDIQDTSVWSQVSYLVAILISFRVSMYIALRWKLSM
ncbi:ATP-binding cassette subfamily G member 4 [Planococcus citri]|uniref:ATP-binding cassette subfamily G member 4 n=1 Tax=Planococcus citri TaxID=170843 RepID=UPI0031FA35BA